MVASGLNTQPPVPYSASTIATTASGDDETAKTISTGFGGYESTKTLYMGG